jgi:replicative DNA helicase
MAVGVNFLSAILKSGDAANLASLAVPDAFYTDSEIELRDIILDHLSAFGVLPTIEAIAVASGGEIIDLPDAQEHPDYYRSQMLDRHVSRELTRTFIAANEHLKSKPPKPHAALDVVVTQVGELFLAANTSRIVDFTQSKDIVVTEAKKALGMAGTYIKFGWPHLDNMTTGARGGDFIPIVGRPGRGKTWMGLWLALRAWEQGHTVIFVSMEMSKEEILQRLAAMYTNIDVSMVMSGQLGMFYGKALNAKLTDLEGKKSPPLWIVEGSRYATVGDIKALTVQMQPTLVVVDGAYMLRVPDFRGGRFEAMSETAHLLKHEVAAPMNIPVVASYQFNRDLDKKTAKNADASADGSDIYGSDSMMQLGSLVLGLLEAENVSTLQRRKMSVLKGRKGERGEFYINWNFQTMDFTQWAPPEELGYLD